MDEEQVYQEKVSFYEQKISLTKERISILEQIIGERTHDELTLNSYGLETLNLQAQLEGLNNYFEFYNERLKAIKEAIL